MDKGQLVYEYNMMIIERYIVRSTNKLPAGKHKIEVDTKIAKPGAPATVVLTVDGAEVARTTVERTVPAAFTASETFDVGVDLGSPVSLDYFDRSPFAFNGKINNVTVELRWRGNEQMNMKQAALSRLLLLALELPQRT
jgi:arylsulfatase